MIYLARSGGKMQRNSVRRKRWVGPLVLATVIVAFVVLFVNGRTIAPFVYSMF